MARDHSGISLSVSDPDNLNPLLVGNGNAEDFEDYAMSQYAWGDNIAAMLDSVTGGDSPSAALARGGAPGGAMHTRRGKHGLLILVGGVVLVFVLLAFLNSED